MRRQAQFLTRSVEVRATSYDTLKAEAAKAFGIADPDTFTLRELITSDRDARDIKRVSFSQISSDLLLTFMDELPLMPGLHSNFDFIYSVSCLFISFVVVFFLFRL